MQARAPMGKSRSRFSRGLRRQLWGDCTVGPIMKRSSLTEGLSSLRQPLLGVLNESSLYLRKIRGIVTFSSNVHHIVCKEFLKSDRLFQSLSNPALFLIIAKTCLRWCFSLCVNRLMHELLLALQAIRLGQPQVNHICIKLPRRRRPNQDLAIV